MIGYEIKFGSHWFSIVMLLSKCNPYFHMASRLFRKCILCVQYLYTNSMENWPLTWRNVLDIDCYFSLNSVHCVAIYRPISVLFHKYLYFSWKLGTLFVYPVFFWYYYKKQVPFFREVFIWWSNSRLVAATNLSDLSGVGKLMGVTLLVLANALLFTVGACIKLTTPCLQCLSKE